MIKHNKKNEEVGKFNRIIQYEYKREQWKDRRKERREERHLDG